MKTVVSVDSDRLCYTRGGGFLTFVGAPLLALGALFLSVPLGSGEPLGASGLVMLVNGSFLALAGAALAFGRRRTVVDKARNLVTQSWELFAPWRSTWKPLSEYRRVTIDTRRPNTGTHRFTLYALSLADREGRETIVLYTPSEELVQGHARQLSEFLGLPV
ncbi:MAG TPA: hypothetical protein PLE19_13730 [Planctomycetota bacterium]|nr:hypothetical protein [Planctomycetota bacterium]HRR80603.1 hypothetical protein [Planctomycetota bacterium]HRT95733.1 hypothetical protein [Planctomycetota bacterium]